MKASVIVVCSVACDQATSRLHPSQGLIPQLYESGSTKLSFRKGCLFGLNIMKRMNGWLCVILKVLGKYQKVIVQWPCILSLIFLLGRFIYMLVKDVRIHLQLEQEVIMSTA